MINKAKMYHILYPRKSQFIPSNVLIIFSFSDSMLCASYKLIKRDSIKRMGIPVNLYA